MGSRALDQANFQRHPRDVSQQAEFEHGVHDPQTDVTGDDPIITGKIALAYLKEFPDFYEHLERLEREAQRDRAEKQP